MNTIIEELFAAYLENKLAAKPRDLTDEESEELEAVERRCAPTKEDLRYLENYIFKYGHMHEQHGFYAGFRTAFDLFAEVCGIGGVIG